MRYWTFTHGVPESAKREANDPDDVAVRTPSDREEEEFLNDNGDTPSAGVVPNIAIPDSLAQLTIEDPEPPCDCEPSGDEQVVQSHARIPPRVTNSPAISPRPAAGFT